MLSMGKMKKMFLLVVIIASILGTQVSLFAGTVTQSVEDIPKPGLPNLNVSMTDSLLETADFSWSATTDTTNYDLRILQDDIVIRTIYAIDGISYSIELLPGDYSAYLCSVNTDYLEWWTAGNVIDFTVLEKTNEIILQVNNKNMIINNEQKAIDSGADTYPMIVNNRVLLPVRSLVEAMGGEVTWKQATSEVEINYQDKLLTFMIDSRRLINNGNVLELDVPPSIYNDRTYIPIRALVENLGAEVIWVEDSQAVIVTYSNKKSIVVTGNKPIVSELSAPEDSPPIVNQSDELSTDLLDMKIPPVETGLTESQSNVPVPASITDGIYTISSKADGRLMNAFSDQISTVAWRVVSAPSDNSSEQKFRIVKQSDGSYIFYNMNYGEVKKITIISNSYNTGSKIGIRSESIPAYQRFYLYDKGNGTYTISPADAKDATIVIGVSNNVVFNSFNYLEMTEYSGSNQEWKFISQASVTTVEKGYKQLISPNPNVACKPNWCLTYVRNTFSIAARDGSATIGWNKSAYKHTDKNFPTGCYVPIWFSVQGVPEGHVALLTPEGKVYSASSATSTTPILHSSIDDLIKYYSNANPLTYLGWSEDVNGIRVVAPK